MEQNTLKKEFSKRDVQRMRNLITGKSGEKTQVQSGWEKNNQIKKEGDIWEENGKTWTIKKGIKQNITKMDNIKKMSMFPLTCPNCKKHMKSNDLNKKMYSMHSMCFDCVIEYEQELKKQGKWEEYAENIQKQNKNTYLEDIETALEAWYNEKESHVTEDGHVETWLGGDKKVMYEQLKEQLNKIKSEHI